MAQELFGERRVQDHLERTEVGERRFDHRAAACAIGGGGRGREGAAVPVQDRRLQDADRYVLRLAERGLEVFSRLVDQPGRVGGQSGGELRITGAYGGSRDRLTGLDVDADVNIVLSIESPVDVLVEKVVATLS